MNFKQFRSLLSDNPLCGISTYKDELNLATGACTRKIKKLVLDGTEGWTLSSSRIFYTSITSTAYNNSALVICSHFEKYSDNPNLGVAIANVGTQLRLYDVNSVYNDVTAFTTYLQQQYAAGTPVIVWYVLATSTTETITVPTGLSGTEEGYLNQSGTPTPTNPIYPTANEVKVWHDTPHYVHNTSTDTLTTLPAVVYANDTTATVGLKGNMEQSSQPTPTTPIQPQECGERTGNLFDKNATNVNNGYISDGYLRSDGSINTNTDYRASEYIRISQNQRYTLYYGASLNNPSVCFYDSAKNYISGIAYANRWDVPFTTPQNAEYLRLSFRAVDSSSVILNLGSIRLPYEPYGIKIPISSANTTTPVYLGEVETTRYVRKLVLDGTEDWKKRPYNDAIHTFELSLDFRIINGLCSHYAKYYGPNIDKIDGIYLSNTSAIIITDLRFTTPADFKSFLAQQYTNGTPVIVWYVLATPTTGIVNEPLRKIGDYADTVSGITIPTITGANTLSIGTTLQPSEVTVNYKGWHPVADVHERESGQWD